MAPTYIQNVTERNKENAFKMSPISTTIQTQTLSWTEDFLWNLSFFPPSNRKHIFSTLLSLEFIFLILYISLKIS